MPILKQSTNPQENFTITSVVLRGVNKYAAIENNIITLDIYESLDGFTSGTVTINDVLGLSDQLDLQGLEAIDVRFASIHGKDVLFQYVKTFRITGISRSQNDPSNKEVLILRFTNNLMVIDDFNKQAWAFKKTSISNMVKTILESFGDDKPADYEIEDTLFQKDYVAGVSKPIETIFKLAKNASSKTTGGSRFLFYENTHGIQFKSLAALREQHHVYTIYQGYTNGSEKFSSGKGHVIVASRIVVNEQSDVLHLKKGMFGNRVFSHSLIRKKLVQHDLKREQFFTALPALNDTPHMSSDELEDEMDVVEQPLNNVQLVPADGFYRSDEKYDTGHLKGVSKMESVYMDSKKITVEIAGNTNLTVGDVVYMNFTSIISEQNGSKLASGRWLIKELRHALTQNDFKTTLELVCDSSPSTATSAINQ